MLIHRISSSPVVTLSPSGRASKFAISSDREDQWGGHADAVSSQQVCERITVAVGENSDDPALGEQQDRLDNDTWWECDYCSRAFGSLDVASAHELVCVRNPANKKSRSLQRNSNARVAESPELQRLVSPGHLCSPVAEALR